MPPRGRPRKWNTRMAVAVDAMGRFGFEEDLVVKAVKWLLKDVYGGEDYWPLIEEDNYNALLEILLQPNAENGNDNVGEGQGQGEGEGEGEGEEGEIQGERQGGGEGEGSHLQNNSTHDQDGPSSSVCTTSSVVAESEPTGHYVVQEEAENVAPPQRRSPVRNIGYDPPVERNENGCKGITLGQTSHGNGVGNRDGFAQTNSFSGHINGVYPSSTVGTFVQPGNHHTIRRPAYGFVGIEESDNNFRYLTPAPIEHPNGEAIRGRKRRWDET